MSIRTDPAQAAAVRDYRMYAAEINREVRQLQREGKPLMAHLARRYAEIARKAAVREASPEMGA